MRDDLILEWSESDGPTVQQPRRKGFGTTIIERSMPRAILYRLGAGSVVTVATIQAALNLGDRGEQTRLPMEHRSRIVVQKRYTLEAVARAVHDLMAEPAPAEGTTTAAPDTRADGSSPTLG